MPERVYLGLDTATPYLALALWSPDTGAVASRSLHLDRDHARRVLGELEELLAVAGLDRTDIAGIGVGLGPGSYTGLRVGIATARGLARALRVTLGGRSSLEAAAYGALEPGMPGIIAHDARRGNVYAGVYKGGYPVGVLTPAYKSPRAKVIAAHPHLPYLEDITPDAELLARAVHDGRAEPVEATYL